MAWLSIRNDVKRDCAPIERIRIMSIGLVGRKIGMTRIFTDEGDSVAVTVVDVAANYVTQIKSVACDGYSAIQVGFGLRKVSRINKSQKAHFAKAGIQPSMFLREFSVLSDELVDCEIGRAIGAEVFTVGQLVDVTGTSQGKGYAGAIKRHHFRSNRASHGNSVSHNAPGSIGNRQDPGRVFPGKRMSGHLGAVRRTVQRLEVVRVNVEKGLLLVKGAVPGSKGGCVIVRPSVKAGVRQ
jgi:large subunit ribosomal protein L3